MNLEVNGGAVQSTTLPVNHRAATTTEFWIGRYDTSYFNGRIDNVGFWKRLLTANEKAYLYNTGSGRSYAEVFAASP